MPLKDRNRTIFKMVGKVLMRESLLLFEVRREVRVLW